MLRKKQLSTISLNLLYAMSGASFTSQLFGGYVEIRDGLVVTCIADSVHLSNDDVELLYQEFVWNRAKRETVNE